MLIFKILVWKFIKELLFYYIRLSYLQVYNGNLIISIIHITLWLMAFELTCVCSYITAEINSADSFSEIILDKNEKKQQQILILNNTFVNRIVNNITVRVSIGFSVEVMFMFKLYSGLHKRHVHSEVCNNVVLRIVSSFSLLSWFFPLIAD